MLNSQSTVLTGGLRGVWRMNEITAIVLASGFSRRMGCNKLLLDIDGIPMISHVLKLLKDFDFREVLVVTGYSGIERIAKIFGFQTVLNDSPEIGQSHSVVLGVTASPDSGGWLFFNGDTPQLKTGTIRRILETAEANKTGSREKILVPRYGGRPGQPVYFPPGFYGELTALTGDEGGRQVIRRHPSDVCYLDIADAGQGIDIDTPEDLKKLSGD